MKIRKLFIGIFLMLFAFSVYGCLGITNRTTEPSNAEKETFEATTWAEFKNVDFGVSLEYPSNWDVAQNETGILTFTPSLDSSSFIKIVKLDNHDSKALTDYLNLSDNYSMSKIGLDDLVAIKLAEPPESFSHFYYVERSPYIYKFVYMNLSDKLDYVSDQSFYKILNSFKFIPFATEEVLEETDEEDEDKKTPKVKVEDITEEEAADEATDQEPEESADEATTDQEPKEDPVVSDNVTYFESLPYKFKALYPSNWYYSGEHMGGRESALHRYSFSDEPEGETVATLDIVDEAMPSEAKSINDREISKVTSGSNVIFYVKLTDQVYRISVSSEFEDIADEIALSISEQ